MYDVENMRSELRKIIFREPRIHEVDTGIFVGFLKMQSKKENVNAISSETINVD